jgi:polysaccharide pyruvyl transferase WcaK-like protein
MAPILLAGAYGQHNPGDEALLAAFLEALDGYEVVVTSQDPVTTEHLHGVAAMTPAASNVAEWLRHGRHLVVGGGTIFKTLHPSTGRRANSLLVRTLALTKAARARGITVSLVGVGAGRLPSARARRLARAIATDADLLVLRDEESASVLASAGVPTPVRVGADPAWTLFDAPLDHLTLRREPHGPARNGSVLVALSHHAGGDDLDARLTDALAATRSVTQIDLQPWQVDEAGLDHHLARAVHDRLAERRPDLRVTIIDPPADLHQAAASCARYDVLLGMRFHALVAAAATGTPFVAVAHEPKLAGLATRFDQRWVPPHASGAVIAHAVDRGAEQTVPDRGAARIEAAKASEAFRLLRLVLTGGATATDEPVRTRLDLSTGSANW